MPQIFLPPRVARELADKTRSYREDLWRSIEPELPPALFDLARALQNVDSRLLLVRARDEVVPGVALRPGYYHVLVDSGPHSSIPISATPIEGAGGEWTEPTWRVLQRLAEGDMREQRTLDRWAANRQAEYDANEAQRRRDREERQEHLRDLVNAYTRTSVSVTQARPWTQNNQPSSRRDAGQRRKR